MGLVAALQTNCSRQVAFCSEKSLLQVLEVFIQKQSLLLVEAFRLFSTTNIERVFQTFEPIPSGKSTIKPLDGTGMELIA